MSATIHYLRPFERETLREEEPKPAATAQDQPAAEEEAEASAPQKPKRRRTMPCGRNSRFKKRMDGTVVPRDKS